MVIIRLSLGGHLTKMMDISEIFPTGRFPKFVLWRQDKNTAYGFFVQLTLAIMEGRKGGREGRVIILIVFSTTVEIDKLQLEVLAVAMKEI